MFINHPIIAIIFRLLNFGLIIIAARYCFKKYILPNILVLMTKKEFEKEALLSQEILLQQQQVELDENIEHDKIKCAQLMKKIDIWKNVVKQYRQEQEDNRIKQEADFIKKQEQRKAWQQQALTQSFVAQKVVSELQTSLADYFDNEKNGVQYLQEIVRLMK